MAGPDFRGLGQELKLYFLIGLIVLIKSLTQVLCLQWKFCQHIFQNYLLSCSWLLSSYIFTCSLSVGFVESLPLYANKCKTNKIQLNLIHSENVKIIKYNVHYTELSRALYWKYWNIFTSNHLWSNPQHRGTSGPLW